MQNSTSVSARTGLTRPCTPACKGVLSLRMSKGRVAGPSTLCVLAWGEAWHVASHVAQRTQRVRCARRSCGRSSSSTGW